jgi:hypothetical protein
MYGGIGNSLLAGCIMKWPWLIPVAMFGLGGVVYESCFGGSASVAPTVAPAAVAPAPTPVVAPASVVEVPKPIVVEPPKPVTPPPPLPPKKIKG